MTSLFISDLHLHENRPLITEAFFSFLQNSAANAKTLFILGDLFDAWIGDDDDSPLALSVASHLKAISKSGVKIFFQHGNRDFLLGEVYAKKCGMKLLPELYVLNEGNERWLLAHGDQFCTDDKDYQAFRMMVRNPAWKVELMKKTLIERRALAKDLREKSLEANSLKADDIMDVNHQEIAKVLKQYNCTKIIHGHTHRPARHKIPSMNATQNERIVLGDWDTHIWHLSTHQGMLHLIKTPL